MNPADLFANPEGARLAMRRAQAQLRPPPNVKPSEWAERSLKIPEGNAKPGPYRLANAPYQREPMDMAVNPDCRRITLKWGAQVGKTLTAQVIQGFSIEVQPRSQMMMQPSQSDLQTWLETKFNPMVAANAAMRQLVAKARGREGVNNQKMKSYPGGFMMFAWAGSPKTMRGRSAPLIVCDEVDGYAHTPEGHPVGLLWQRSATFMDERFLVEISTPTTKGESYIDDAYLAGDMRQFHVGCPHCGEHQVLHWSNVSWQGRCVTSDDDAANMDGHLAETARYVCTTCGGLWDDGERIAAIRNAESTGGGWRAQKPFRGHASYHLNELYSTFRRLRDIVQDYLDKLATDDLQTFVNVSQAECWEEKGEKVDPDSLLARREDFAAQVPMQGLYLTAGVDMQGDRLEVEIVAWGEGEESWSVDYRVLWGDPLGNDVWDELDDVLVEKFTHETGHELPISATCLDTGGTNGYTQRAYEYARGRTGRNLFAIKGQGGWGIPIVASPSRKKSGQNARKVDLFMVGVDEAKLVVARRLAKGGTRGPGVCHFPMDREPEWFKQITSEKLKTRYVKGQPIREWHKPDRARNEALDCRVYALAALKIKQPSFKRIAAKLGVKLLRPEVERDPAPLPPPAAGQDTPPPRPPLEEIQARVAKLLDAPRQAANDPPPPPRREAPATPPEAPQAPPNRPAGVKRSKSLGHRGGGWVRNF